MCLSVQCTLAVGVEPAHCSHLAGPAYGSQPGGELPFAKLDNRPGSLSEDWRGSSTCCSWHRARPALLGSGKGRPGCSRSWQVAELGVDGRAGVCAAHWLPRLLPRPPPELAAPQPAPASPAASELPEQAPPAMSSCDRIGVAPAMDMPEVLKSLLEHSLPWPEKRTGRNGGGLHRLATQVPKGWGQPEHSGRTGISKLGRAPWSLPGQEEGLGCRERHSGECHGNSGTAP